MKRVASWPSRHVDDLMSEMNIEGRVCCVPSSFEVDIFNMTILQHNLIGQGHGFHGGGVSLIITLRS